MSLVGRLAPTSGPRSPGQPGEGLLEQRAGGPRAGLGADVAGAHLADPAPAAEEEVVTAREPGR